jgi:hypothetical protein
MIIQEMKTSRRQQRMPLVRKKVTQAEATQCSMPDFGDSESEFMMSVTELDKSI